MEVAIEPLSRTRLATHSTVIFVNVRVKDFDIIS